MRVVLFEDAAWEGLYPFTLSRPAFDLRVGVTSLARRLMTQLARHEMKRVDLLCRDGLRPLVERDYPGHDVNGDPEGPVLFLNGRLVVTGEGLDTLLELVERGVAIADDGVPCAVLAPADAATGMHRALAAALREGTAPPPPRERSVVGLPEGLRLARYPWDLIAWNAEVLQADFEWVHSSYPGHPPSLAPGAQVLHRDRVLCREEVKVEAGAILDAGSGPILLGEGVHILHNAVVQGPVYLGPGSVVKVGAKIEGPVSTGPRCKIGGEVEGCIFQGYGNKQHDGFLGHAYLGAWTNLGAATNNSDLKNNYSTVRVFTPGGEVATGSLFVGLLMGDHSKSAIGTCFNTGTVVGFSANVIERGFPPKHVPSFSWGGDRYDLDKAMATARTVMARRNQVMEPADEVLFRSLYASEARYLG